MKTSTRNSVRIATLLGFLQLALAIPSAQADRKKKAHGADTSAQVLVVLATEKPGVIDAELKGIKALAHPPFNSFRGMKVLSKPRVTLAPGKPAEVALPNGRKLKLTIQQKQADGKYLIGASLKAPKKKKYTMLLRVVAAPGAPFFVAGQKHDGGTLIVGVTLER